MSAVSKFGQYVFMEVYDESDALVFSADDLRIDFDIRHLPDWTRAKFTVHNLAPSTIKKLSHGKNYVTVSVRLHDNQLTVVARDLYVSNAIEEIKVPDSIFSMFCYSKTRKEYFEKQIDIKVERPTLKRVVQACVEASDFEKEVKFKHFPAGMLDYRPPRLAGKYKGSLITCLKKLGAKGNYRFNIYTEGDGITIMYKPDAKNVKSTDLYSGKGEITLSTDNMKANPKLGPANLSVTSNLDPEIKPSTILDISELLTIGSIAGGEVLEVGEDYLRDSVAGFSKYQALAVQHKGSNWTNVWLTQVSATSPTKGTDMSTDKWWA